MSPLCASGSSRGFLLALLVAAAAAAAAAVVEGSVVGEVENDASFVEFLASHASHQHAVAEELVTGGVEVAGPARIVTRQVACELRPEIVRKHGNHIEGQHAQVSAIAERHGHEFLGPIGSLSGHYLLLERSGRSGGAAAAAAAGGRKYAPLSEAPELVNCTRQVAQQRMKRGVFEQAGLAAAASREKRQGTTMPDPLFPQQWHLQSSSLSTVHCNVQPVWAQGVTGEGVTIGVVDDGLQWTHPDIGDGYRADLSYDFNYNDADPIPDQPYDNHGTSAGGAAGAASNSACGVGSAPGASLSGQRLISKATTDADEAGAVSYKNQGNDIYTNSWGPYDDGKRLEGPGPLAAAAMEDCVQNGRGGRGNIYVWAGGNGRSAGDNCNYDGWANRRYTLTVGAVDYRGVQSYYSENCAALAVVAPSSGSNSQRGITTTDRLGTPGNTRTDCYSGFGGTSAAAPIAAGIVAEVLQVNKQLGWRDVQGIIMTTANRNFASPTDADWKQNGAGRWVNHKFGFGMIDAAAAVAAARTWKNYPDPVRVHTETYSVSTPIPEDSSPTAGASMSVENTVSMTLEHVEVRFRASHSNRGQVRITLVAPSGLESVLQERHSDFSRNFNWTYGSTRHWGENSAGTWTLRVVDQVSDDSSGAVNGWDVVFYGH